MRLRKTNKIPAKKTGLYYLLLELQDNKTYSLNEIEDIIDDMKSSDSVPEDAKRYVNDNLKSNVKTFALPNGFFEEISPIKGNTIPKEQELDKFWADYKKELKRIESEELDNQKHLNYLLEEQNKINQEIEKSKQKSEEHNKQRLLAKEEFDKLVNPFAKGNSDDNLAAA